jgi:ABC-2 type transport system permease protein
LKAIFKKELKLYFSSLSGYVLLAFFVFITALYFIIINISQNYLDYQYVISNTSIIFLIIIPLLTMRLFSEEARNKSDQLIFTAPVSSLSIVLGKYFAALFLFFIAMLITVIFPIILSFFGALPVAQIVGTYIGNFLLAACFISVGLFISALSDNQVAVAITTFGSIFLFFILDSLSAAMPVNKSTSTIFLLLLIIILSNYIYNRTKIFLMSFICFLIFTVALIIAYILNLEFLDAVILKISNWFSLMSRFSNFASGILNLSDIIYYLSFVIFFLYLTMEKIESRKY